MLCSDFGDGPQRGWEGAWVGLVMGRRGDENENERGWLWGSCHMLSPTQTQGHTLAYSLHLPLVGLETPNSDLLYLPLPRVGMDLRWACTLHLVGLHLYRRDH